ncbi:hypothetical protein ACC687_42765, partial [Rhizobium ruizarguesonis]
GVKRRHDAEAGRMPEDTVERLIAAHLTGLAGLPCRSCLVTDIAYSVIDRNGKTHEEAERPCPGGFCRRRQNAMQQV